MITNTELEFKGDLYPSEIVSLNMMLIQCILIQTNV
jgi:hypothetical protein